MNNLKSILSLCITVICVNACGSHDGADLKSGTVGNHSDFFHRSKSESWFWKQHGIRACVVKAPESIDAQNVLNAAIAATENFKTYIDSKIVGDQAEEGRRQAKAAVPTISNSNPRCGGQPELKISIMSAQEAAEMFGVSMWESELSGLFRFKDDTMTLEQHLWLSPEAAKSDALGTIMMHQFGHMAGIAHIDGTIMAEGQFDELQAEITTGKVTPRSIDQDYEVLTRTKYQSTQKSTDNMNTKHTGCYGDVPATIYISNEGDYRILAAADKKELRRSEWVNSDNEKTLPDYTQITLEEVFMRPIKTELTVFNFHRAIWRGLRKEQTNASREIIRLNPGKGVYVSLENSQKLLFSAPGSKGCN